MPLLSEDFCRAKLAKEMRGRDERFFRDSKLTGFVCGCGDPPTTRCERIGWSSNR